MPLPSGTSGDPAAAMNSGFVPPGSGAPTAWEMPADSSVMPPGIPLNDPAAASQVIEPLGPAPPGAIPEWAQASLTPPKSFVYRSGERRVSVLAAGQLGLGSFDYEETGYLRRSKNTGLNFGFGLHFLKGPVTPDLHARLYDIYWTYQHRGQLPWGSSIDMAAGVGFFTDFEDSVRDGVRFPSHAVMSTPMGGGWSWVLGIDYLDRDDYQVLPVAGLRWSPRQDFDLHLEIPNPKAIWHVNEVVELYAEGRLGGGTWDIEYVDAGDDVLTLRQWELLVGWLNQGSEEAAGLEIGYVIDRTLEFRSGQPDLSLPNAWVFRLVTRY